MAAGNGELTVDKEFESLCPKLTDDERKLLEAAIEADGCRDAIVTWANHDDVIVDGYNRYRICRKKGLGYKTKSLTFQDREAVKAWIITNQLGRRNLNEAQRAILAAELVTTKDGGKQCANLHTDRVAAAEIAGVSPRSVSDAKKVLDKGSSELIEAVKDGEVAVSAAAVVADLPKKEQTKAVKEGKVKEKAAKVRKAKAPKPDKPDYGKCPNCAGTKWTANDEGVCCAKCRHPHGEPSGGADEDRIGIQRSKTIKTAEALMRAFDDLHHLLAKSREHANAIATCKILLKTAREWK